MSHEWKIVNAIEELNDKITELQSFAETVNKTNDVMANWITVVTEFMKNIEKDINYLKHKKTCI